VDIHQPRTPRLGRGEKGNYYLEYNTRSLTFPRNIFHAPKMKSAATLAAALSPGAHVLDAGCGAGYVSAEFSPQLKLIGVDIETEAIDFCKKNRQGKFLVAPLENLPFDKNTFDLILFTNAIEHLENPHPALAELTRVLKPGGKILVTTENCANVFWILLEHTWYRFFGGPCKPYRRDVHPQRYTRRKLRADLEKHLRVDTLDAAVLGMELLAIGVKA
jgi:ubiquinone/menaquinone biosynthesis C-methylase UbiE